MNAPSSQQINPGYSLQSTKSNAGNARTRQESVTGAVPENASQSSTTRNAFMVAAYGWIQKGKQVGSKSSAEGQNGTDEGKPGQDDDDKPNDEADIYGEIENLKEIRDIRDELIILRKLLTEQTDVAKKLFNTNLQSSLTKNTDVMDYYSKRSGLDTRIRELDNMEEEAERIYNLVSCKPLILQKIYDLH
jgi:Mg2+ and Co2+ transporter CorA